MLILERRKGEAIMIGEDMTIRVLGFRDGKARIGIEAPKEIAVHRQEVFDRIKAGIKQVSK